MNAQDVKDYVANLDVESIPTREALVKLAASRRRRERFTLLAILIAGIGIPVGLVLLVDFAPGLFEFLPGADVALKAVVSLPLLAALCSILYFLLTGVSPLHLFHSRLDVFDYLLPMDLYRTDSGKEKVFSELEEAVRNAKHQKAQKIHFLAKIKSMGRGPTKAEARRLAED